MPWFSRGRNKRIDKRIESLYRREDKPPFRAIPSEDDRSETDFVVPDSIVPRIGWRTWVMVGYPLDFTLNQHSSVEAGLLYSPLRGTPWPARQKLIAVCGGGDSYNEKHKVPADRCTCGIYALNEDNFERFHFSWIRSENVFPVVGKVKQWGNIYYGPAGQRSEFAYPCELYLPDEVNRATRDMLSRNYPGIPIYAGLPENIHLLVSDTDAPQLRPLRSMASLGRPQRTNSGGFAVTPLLPASWQSAPLRSGPFTAYPYPPPPYHLGTNVRCGLYVHYKS